jgi:hypothetical protein
VTYQGKVYRSQGGDEMVVASGGKITVQAGGQINVIAPKGTLYFVDSVSGVAGNDGLGWATALATIAAAVAKAVAGDTILLKGSFSEAVTVAVAGVSILGAGTEPSEATWTLVADPSGACLTITAASCVVRNIKFRPPAYASSGTPKAISLSGAHQAEITDCLFQGRAGSHAAIYTDGNNANVLVARNRFLYLNTATSGCAIQGGGYTVGENSGWIVEDNVFHSNVKHIDCRMRQSVIRRNLFGDYGLGPAGSGIQTTVHCNISGATGGWNHVYDNQMEGDYATTANSYVAGTNDSWYGNKCEDIAETEVVPSEVSSVVPAA